MKLHTHTKKFHVRSPNKADMFWKILSSSGVIAGLFSKVTNLHDKRGWGAGRRGCKKKVREERMKQKMGEVVRKEYRRHRLEVAKENGKRNIVGQITETERRKEHGHHQGGKNNTR